MKTITELNSHWWYRLIKVAYIILGLIFIISIFTYLAYDSRPVLDETQTVARCSNGKILSFQNQSVSRAYDYGDTFTLMGLCGDDASVSVNPIYTSFDWINFALGSIVLLLGLFLLLELIKRVFYYIVLGKVIPSKE